MDKTSQVLKTRKPRPGFPLIKELAQRFSPRHFAVNKIPDSDMNTILEAARWAPSGHNSQPWYFYWTDKEGSSFNKILAALPDFNQWSDSASALVVSCYISAGENGTNEFALYDLGASVLAMVLQAQSLGYYVRQMGVFDKEMVKGIVGCKKYEVPFTVVAIGTLGDYSKAKEEIFRRDMTPTPRKSDFARKI